jgi:hypothetical protein
MGTCSIVCSVSNDPPKKYNEKIIIHHNVNTTPPVEQTVEDIDHVNKPSTRRSFEKKYIARRRSFNNDSRSSSQIRIIPIERLDDEIEYNRVCKIRETFKDAYKKNSNLKDL